MRLLHELHEVGLYVYVDFAEQLLGSIAIELCQVNDLVVFGVLKVHHSMQRKQY